MIDQLPRFLVIRFPPGGGGNFLASLLQCSHEVGHWNADIESNKSSADWEQYFEQSFSKDLRTWLWKEPIALNQLNTRNIFSAWYDRGNELTVQEFLNLEKEHCSPLYQDLKAQNKLIVIFWHKDVFPSFFQRACFVNIMLDNSSLGWYDRSWYYKHHSIEYKNGQYTVYRNRHRKDIQPKNTSYKNFDSATYNTFFEFVKQEIYNNPWRGRYLTPGFLDKSSGNRPQYTMHLSDLLEFDKLQHQYIKLCTWLNITAMDETLLQKLFYIWRNRHDY